MNKRKRVGVVRRKTKPSERNVTIVTLPRQVDDDDDNEYEDDKNKDNEEDDDYDLDNIDLPEF